MRVHMKSIDWKKVIEKTENLRKYGLGWWVDDLTPILNEFVLAAEGKANRAFWQNIVMKSNVSVLGSGKTAETVMKEKENRRLPPELC